MSKMASLNKQTTNEPSNILKLACYADEHNFASPRVAVHNQMRTEHKNQIDDLSGWVGSKLTPFSLC